MSERGELIFCPVCRRYSIYRKNQRCRFCSTELYFPDEYIPSNSGGFVQDKKRGWVKVKEWIKQYD